jgi:glycopeptide antibiotics resistance protein
MFHREMKPLLPLIPLGLVAACIAIVAIGSFRARRSGDRSAAFRTATLDVLFGASVLSILALTLSPHRDSGRSIILVPFEQGWHSTRRNAEMLANLLLFVPLGLLGPARWSALDGWERLTLAAVPLSTTIEILQYMFDFGRESSTTDVVLNTLGACVGYGILRVARSVAAVDAPPRPTGN